MASLQVMYLLFSIVLSSFYNPLDRERHARWDWTPVGTARLATSGEKKMAGAGQHGALPHERVHTHTYTHTHTVPIRSVTYTMLWWRKAHFLPRTHTD